MIESNFIATLFISAIIGGCVLFLTLFIIRVLKNNQVTIVTNKKNVNRGTTAQHPQEKDQQPRDATTGKAATCKKSGGTKGTDQQKWTGGNRTTDKHNYTHPWLLTSLKGHTGQVYDMDFSSNGKYLASCADDRTVMLWCLKDLKHKERKSVRVNVDYDHARFIRWSPDSKAFIISRATDQCIEVYKVEKKKEGFLGPVTKALTFPKGHADDSDVIALGIACHGRFIMSCSGKTDMVVWDLKGNELARIDTYLMTTWCAKISPCGRFVVASGFAPDVKVWVVAFSKSGDFQHVKRAFELTGHTSGIYDIAFDQDTSHMATVSKDGTWKIFQTNVEYQKGEDAHLKITGKYDHPHDANAVIHIALSPNAEIVAISVNASLSFYSTRDAVLDRTIEDVYQSGPIENIAFDSSGQYLITSGSRHIRAFHNVTGYKTAMTTTKEKLKIPNQTAATKERLEKLLNDNENFLKSIGEKLKG